MYILNGDSHDAHLFIASNPPYTPGAAIEAAFGAHLTIGPPLSSGFYYDSYMGSNTIPDED